MAQKRLPPETRREHFETKIRVQSNGCWHWHFPSLPTTTFSWTEESDDPTRRRENYALNLRKTSWHYAGRELLPERCMINTCGDPRCINPDHLDQVTYQHARQLVSPEVRALAGRSMIKNFTDDELRDIWIDADSLRGKGLARRYNVCVCIIWNIQKGYRNRDDIIRLFGPQLHWGRDRVRKYEYVKKRSTTNTRTAQRLRSTA